MTNMVRLQNTNKLVSREVHSADGDSLQLMPGAIQPVDAKFNWKLPPDVQEFRPKQTIFGKKGAREVVNKANVLAQSVDVSQDRTTLHTPAPADKKA